MNKVILIGRLTADPELKFTQNGKGYCNFTIAVDRGFKNADGEREADFIYCQAWNKSAENLAKYMGKGRQIAVEGRLQVDRIDQGQGQQAKYVTKVVCDRVEFLADGKGKQEGQQGQQPAQGTVYNSAGDVMGTEVSFSDEGLPF